jgi:hypothetical protein
VIPEILRIATHPAVWPGFGGKADPETWNPPMREGVEWFVDGATLVCFIRMRPGIWEAHIGALPEERGSVKAKALASIEWLKDKHGPLYLMGSIPKGNPAAIANARAVGMKVLTRLADRTICGMEI